MEREVKDTDNVFEMIVDGKYVKTVEEGREEYRFFIPQFMVYFSPCDDCQDHLHKMITTADHLELGKHIITFKKIVAALEQWRILEVRAPTEEELQDDELPKFAWGEISPDEQTAIQAFLKDNPESAPDEGKAQGT